MQSFIRKYWTWIGLGILFVIVLSPWRQVTHAQPTPLPEAPGGRDPGGIARLLADSAGKAQISVSRLTRTVNFVRLPGSGMDAAQSPALALEGETPQSKAKDFFARYGGIFGLGAPDSALVLVDESVDELGFSRLTFQQTYRGVPVWSAVLRAHFTPQGDLSAVDGWAQAKFGLDTRPKFTPAEAGKLAIELVTTQLVEEQKVILLEGELEAQAVTLMILRTGLARGRTDGELRLVYQVTVGNGAGIREFVFLDAQDGSLVEQFTGVYEQEGKPDLQPQAPSGLTRETRNRNFTHGYPTVGEGALCWNDGGQQGTYISACDLAFSYSGEVYNMYWNGWTRDSLDNAGMRLYTTVNVCPPTLEGSCPWANAYWDGALMAFGNLNDASRTSLAELDDVVGHEMSHAITEFTSGLIYAWQSGAINEAFSDVMGESLDILNGHGRGDSNIGVLRTNCTNSTRWKMGEDFFAIRDMWDPTCVAGDPDKVSSPSYVCSTTDNGGVHTNSSIINHAYAILVDGQTFNGQTVAGIGLIKAMHIYYRANTVYLTPTSDFSMLADALEQSCADLAGINLKDPSPIGGGGLSGQVITAADCAELAKSILAVEMRSEPTQCSFQPLLDPSRRACEVTFGEVAPLDYLFEDFESVTPPALPVGWTASRRNTAATFEPRDWTSRGILPDGRTGQAGYAPDPIVGDCVSDLESGVLQLTSPVVTIPAGASQYYLSFDHYISAEQDYDGGNVKISVNGGAYTLIPASDFRFNPYNRTLQTDNPLSGEMGFSGADGGKTSGSWGTSSVNLAGLAGPGSTVRVRFEFGTDGCNGWDGWYVDNIRIHECGTCGNMTLNSGETCDDGNPSGGDGCSASCQKEFGWESCSIPEPPLNYILDGGFEGGTPNASWTEYGSTPTGSPICSNARCGGPPPGPYSGTWWTWFGGQDVNLTEYVQQTVRISPGSSTLSFQLRAQACGNATSDYFRVLVDGNTLLNITYGDSLCGATSYSEQILSLAAYADGNEHILRFLGVNVRQGTPDLSVHLDTVSLLGLPTPSTCVLYDADYSDLDDQYNLAWHTGGGAQRLGTLWSADTGFARNTDDATDDGISLDSNYAWVEGNTVRIYATVTGEGGYLAAWFDWNDDGDFLDAGEKAIGQAVSPGSNTIDFLIPAGAGYTTPSRQVQARFRLYASEPLKPGELDGPSGGEIPTGGASSGEVEDYELKPQTPTAVSLAWLEAASQVDGVLVSWETLSELNNLGFYIYRAESELGPAELVTLERIPSQAIGTPGGATYGYLDWSAVPGKIYFYWLEMEDTLGGRVRDRPVLVQTWYYQFAPLLAK